MTLFAFPDYFPAVATTDILCRIADVLVSKPSELAFYPVPKLHIRRVGDHEAFSAVRSSELGDGTLEARPPRDPPRDPLRAVGASRLTRRGCRCASLRRRWSGWSSCGETPTSSRP